MKLSSISERALVLAPSGRDASLAVMLLQEAHFEASACASVPELIAELERGAGVAIVTEEAVANADLHAVSGWVQNQAEWSDFPFILLTGRAVTPERNPTASRYQDTFGNITFLERPFHPTTIVSIVRAALRGRRRQYEARSRLATLLESESRLRLATDHAEIGFWDVDPINDKLVWPARVKAMFGVSEDVPVTMADFYNGLHPDDREATTAAYVAASDPIKRALYDVEYRTVGKEDGVVRWVAAKGRGVFDAAGICVRVIGTAMDITARKHTAVALAESEARYQTLFESMDEGFCIIEFLDGKHGPLSDYIHTQANAAYARHAGIPNVVGQKVREMVPGEAEGWIDLYRQVLLTGESIRFERELVATGRYLELAAFRIEPKSRRQVAVLFQDVTARRRAELALRDLNETLERRVAAALAERKILADIVEGTDAFVQVVDNDYRWLAINKASTDEFERIFGIRPRAGDSMLELLASQPDHLEAVRAVWSRALAGEEFTEIAEFGDPSRTRRFYEMKYNTLRGQDGERVGAYQFVYDVTERLRDQKRLAQAQEALRQAQKMEAVGQLTGGVAHDFNNLLAVVSSGLQLMDRDQDPDKRKRIVQGVRHAVERGASLTRHLLSFSRSSPVNPQSTDLALQVDGMRDLLERALSGNITIEMTFEPEIWPVEVDPSELEIALLNLCVNARDAMPKGGAIKIAMANVTGSNSRQMGDAVRLSVTDVGTGMSAAVKERVFEPFFTTKDIGKGSGLGLAQVYGFARQSGGTVEIDTELGRGTTVALFLPRSGKPATPVAKPVEGVEIDNLPSANVLLVEDDHQVAEMAKEMLESIGFRVTHAADASAALDALGNGAAYDVVFSDVMMPGGMNGVELARQIRRRKPTLPVVLTTAFEVAARNADADGIPVLFKPYQLQELSRVLRGQIAHYRGDR